MKALAVQNRTVAVMDNGNLGCHSREADRKTVRRDEKYDSTRSEVIC